MARARRYDGRYSYIHSQWWSDPAVKTLSLEERHLLLCLRTGRLATSSGLIMANLDALRADYQAAGPTVTREEIEALLGALEKRPRASDSFIVRDQDVIWVRHQLQDDPMKRSILTIKGIKYDLSRMPRGSRVVRMFCRYYADLLGKGTGQAPGKGSRPRPGPGTGQEPEPEPETETEPEPETGGGKLRSASPAPTCAPGGASSPAGTGGEGEAAATPPAHGEYDRLLADIRAREPGLSDEEAGVRALHALAGSIARSQEAPGRAVASGRTGEAG